MNKTIGKIFIVAGIISAILILGRGLYYAPNGDLGTGLGIGSSSTSASTTDVASAIKATSTPFQKKTPSRLIIPKIDVDADIQHVGVTKTGNMAAPNNFIDVSWYKFGTLPGKVGSAVISGHQNNALSNALFLDGVFANLDDLKIGDRVYVMDEFGKKLEFKVVETQVYPYNKAPLERIFAASGKARLNLITCAGSWLASAKTNDHRLVVYTELVTN